MKYFLCQNRSCCSSNRSGLLSTFRNRNCSCGLIQENRYVKETATFIIFDNLYVMPNVIGTSVRLLQDLRVRNIQAIEEITYLISAKEACFLGLYISLLLIFLLFILYLIFDLCRYLIFSSCQCSQILL